MALPFLVGLSCACVSSARHANSQWCLACCCSGKLHAWFPRLWGPPLVASITKDAPAYTDVLWQVRRDAAISMSLAAIAVGAVAVAGRVALQKL